MDHKPSTTDAHHVIDSVEGLRALYGHAQGRARDKQLDHLEWHGQNFIRHAPFVILSTYGKDGRADSSPRGGAPGFVQVLDSTTLVIPDGKGNNRIDSMINIVETGRIGLLFLIPGVDETLRINGTATVTTDPGLLERFADERHPPKTCIRVEVDEVFLHCAKALMRSRLWADDSRIERKSFPSMGQMLNEQIGLDEVPEPQEAMVARYQSDL